MKYHYRRKLRRNDMPDLCLAVIAALGYCLMTLQSLWPHGFEALLWRLS